ncbi:MAG: flagellar basal body L-ring protein FlgH [Rhizobiaceae bacterium]
MIRRLAFLLATASLCGCSAQAMKEIGKEPEMSTVGSGYTERAIEAYPREPSRPVSQFSLWNDRQSRLFTDPRALSVGDILTVRISINDRAKFKNESERNRTSDRSLGADATLGWDGFETSGAGDVGVKSGSKSTGTGATARSEDIDLMVAAIVTDVLPNGNLIIQGSQEVRVNAELRILTIGGIVRPSDIGAQNMISYERIAEARISYGGRGRLTEVQQPPYGQQILDHILPF